MHGRSLPGAGRDLFEDFAAALASWEWEVVLLQEVPPWWPARLGARLGASARTVLTSRNALMGARRAVAQRWPDVIKSNGGGCNAILVSGSAIVAHRRLRLAWVPERRWLHAVALRTPRAWIGNLHATVHRERRAVAEAERAARQLLAWAAGTPALLGGDFNVRALSLPGWTHAGGHDVDHVFVAGCNNVLDAPRTLDRGWLSDHAPVAVCVDT